MKTKVKVKEKETKVKETKEKIKILNHQILAIKTGVDLDELNEATN